MTGIHGTRNLGNLTFICSFILLASSAQAPTGVILLILSALFLGLFLSLPSGPDSDDGRQIGRSASVSAIVGSAPREKSTGVPQPGRKILFEDVFRDTSLLGEDRVLRKTREMELRKARTAGTAGTLTGLPQGKIDEIFFID